MHTSERLAQHGEWLFRWRSYLPLLFFPILLLAAKQSEYFFGMRLYDLVWELSCLAVSMFGLLIRAYTVGHTPKGTSGRNTKRQVADSLNTTGIYSIVRNPLYVGNFFMMLGVIMFYNVWWCLAIYVPLFILYYERIIVAEEKFLYERFGRAFQEYYSRTPAVIPNPRLWQAPDYSFSLRNVLKREYSGFFAILASFAFLEFWEDFTERHYFYFDPVWLNILLCGLIVYLILRSLKKYTKLLHVEGR